MKYTSNFCKNLGFPLINFGSMLALNWEVKLEEKVGEDILES